VTTPGVRGRGDHSLARPKSAACVVNWIPREGRGEDTELEDAVAGEEEVRHFDVAVPGL
jgi:hypothetical protein